MLPVAGRIPDVTRAGPVCRTRLASQGRGHRGGGLAARLRKAVTQQTTGATSSELPSFGQVTKAEKGLIWWLVHDRSRRWRRWRAWSQADLEGLASRSVLDLAQKLNEDRGFSPSVLLERLSMVEAQLVTAIASEPEAHVH